MIPSASSASPAPPFRRTVAALAVAQILAWATLFYAFSAFVLPMQRDTGWSRPLVMGAFTLGLAVWGACAYGVGAAIDHGHGRRVMVGGALAGAAGFALWAVAAHPWMLYAAWALLGLAQAATLYDPAFVWLTRRYPDRYREGITALTLVAGFASTICYPAVAALQAWLGWRGALLALGAVQAVGVAPALAWAMRHDVRPRAADVPGPAIGAATPAAVPGAPATAASASDEFPSAAPPPPHRTGLTLAEAVRTRSFWLLTVAFLLYAFVTAALWAHVMPALASAGVSGPAAVSVLVWFGPSQVAGRLLHLVVGRHWPLRRVGAAVLALMSASLAVFALGRGTAAMTVFCVGFGLSNGLVTIVRGGIVPELFGAAHVGRIGGAMSTVGLLARAVAPVLAAWWLVALPGYRGLLLALAGLGAGAALALRAARHAPWTGVRR